ncbi:hypothetical protein [Bradyrhizobium sp. 2TAF24]|uniref:hypothetical protein n=1 Tax=Bradyrhizobium sp. 2TAF24 TaxID=3233011 RepID=UPI003F8FE096
MSQSRVHRHKGRPRPPVPGALPDDLYDYYDNAPSARRSASHTNAPRTRRVVDDWPERVPITVAEIEVFERWFADVFNELFGPTQAEEDLTKLSQSDNNTNERRP